MRFDSTKALETFRELGDPRFSGPDNESRVADLVAERFFQLGLSFERRQVVGSAFPQSVAPWIGPLGYGILITGAYLLVLPNSVVSSVFAVFLWLLSAYWVNGFVANSTQLGHRRPPLQEAPVVIASMKMASTPPLRVVFQALVGGLESDLTHLLKWPRARILGLLTVGSTLLILDGVACKIMLVLGAMPPRVVVSYDVLIRYACPGFLAIAWIVISRLLYSHFRALKRMETSHQPERYGLALLLELARTWPRAGARAVEPVFVAAGGQRLDYAGSREVVRLLGSEWSTRPSLLILLLAPGAGEKVWLSTNDLVTSDTDKLATEAARSLWIPIVRVSPFNLLSLWPFENCHPTIALIGSESGDSSDPSLDPQALHRVAQLATEIALRWARKPQASASATDSAT
jgi:hypothetical protein